MKTNSIFFKIRIAFAISAFLILAVFALLYFIQEYYKSAEFRERLMHASKIAKHLKDEPQEMSERLSSLELEVADEGILEQILSSKNSKELKVPGPIRIILSEENGKKYIAILHPKGENVFIDKKASSPTELLLMLALLTILGVLAMFYRSILLGLTPLGELKCKVEEFAKNGEFAKSEKKLCDELGALSDAFKNTSNHLTNISKARSLFLRNIAHELKTPLSKGRFLAEMIKDEALQERFHTLFSNFDVLVNELLQIERLTATGIRLDKKNYRPDDMLDEAIENGFLDSTKIDIDGSGEVLFVDFRLFTLALKNLLSNAIKHSQDGNVSVRLHAQTITISNKGTPLSRPIEQLYEPFVKGDESSDGMGLGLYIVSQIIEAHDAKLSYEYKDGVHSFILSL